MAKSFSSAVGVDIGQHTIKAVHLHWRGSQIVLSGFATRPIGASPGDAEQLAHHLKLLLGDLRLSGKAYGLASSDPQSVLRLIDQPPTPLEVLRTALKINGTALLHQDLRDFVLDCDNAAKTEESKKAWTGKQEKFVVAGLSRVRIGEYCEAFSKNRCNLARLTLAPLALFGAFEFSRPDVFVSTPFLLLDIGYDHCTVIGGLSGALIMVRTIDYGGRQLVSDLSMGGSAVDGEGIRMLLQQGDAGLADALQLSLSSLAREVINSIGFFEGQWDRTIGRVFVSGGPAASEMVLQLLSDGINLPCEVWDPLDRCESSLSAAKRGELGSDACHLNVAFGSALELMHE